MRMTFVALACALAAAAASPAEPVEPCRRADAVAQALDADQAATFEYAMQLFVERRYPAAYGRFARLADAGHVPSAQAALFMHAHGGRLFASEWEASAPQLRRWNALVGCAASRGGVAASAYRGR